MKTFWKTTLVVTTLLSFNYGLSAQTVGEGAWMIGGSAGFNSIKYADDDNSTTLFNLSPNLGYFIIDDLAIGLRASLYSESYDGDSESQFGIGPWARFYVVNNLFAQGGIDFGPSQFDLFSWFSGEGSTNIHLGVGYSWFLNNSVAIEPILLFNSFTGDEDLEEGDYTRFGLNISVQAFLHHEHGLDD